jgi:N-acetylneuraminic acid mutarotase
MNAPRSTGFALIVNKRVYVFGGYTREGKRSKKIERYTPAFDSWDILNVRLMVTLGQVV